MQRKYILWYSFVNTASRPAASHATCPEICAFKQERHIKKAMTEKSKLLIGYLGRAEWVIHIFNKVWEQEESTLVVEMLFFRTKWLFE